MKKVFFSLFSLGYFLAAMWSGDQYLCFENRGRCIRWYIRSNSFCHCRTGKQAVRPAKEGNRNISSVNVYIKEEYQLSQPLVFNRMIREMKKCT